MAPVPDSEKNMQKSLVIVFPEDVLYNLIKHNKLHLLIRVFRVGQSTRLKIGAQAVGLEWPFQLLFSALTQEAALSLSFHNPLLWKETLFPL